MYFLFIWFRMPVHTFCEWHCYIYDIFRKTCFNLWTTVNKMLKPQTTCILHFILEQFSGSSLNCLPVGMTNLPCDVRLNVAGWLLFYVVFVCAKQQTGLFPHLKKGEFCKLLCHLDIKQRCDAFWNAVGMTATFLKMSLPANWRTNFDSSLLKVVMANRQLGS